MGDVCSSITHYVKHPEIYCGRNCRSSCGAVPQGHISASWRAAKGTASCRLPESFPTTDTDSCATTGTRHPAALLIPSGRGRVLSGTGRCRPSTPPEAWTPTTAVYVYARQTGSWRSLLYEGRDKYFYLDYTLRACPPFPCPFSAPTAPVTMMCPMGNSWSCQTVSAHGSSSPPAMATTLTGMRKTCLRKKNCWMRHWYF